MRRSIAIVTEESVVVRRERARAVDMYDGNFRTATKTVEILDERGIKPELFILTSKFGIVPSARIIESYIPDLAEARRNENLQKLSRDMSDILSHYKVILIMLSRQYALILSQAMQGLSRLHAAPLANHVAFIVSGRDGIDALSNALKGFSTQLFVYHRNGVARISLEARNEIIVRLGSL